MGEAVHFVDRQNTLPAQAVSPKLQFSSENVIYNNIFHFYSFSGAKRNCIFRTSITVISSNAAR